jgi:hypothetical protein
MIDVSRLPIVIPVLNEEDRIGRALQDARHIMCGRFVRLGVHGTSRRTWGYSCR